jgi:hypothetical protein
MSAMAKKRKGPILDKTRKMSKADWIWKFPYLFPTALNCCKPPYARKARYTCPTSG